MWPVDRGAEGTLFVYLGARRVDAAIHTRGAWLAGSVVSVPVERVTAPQRPLDVLSTAITNLQAQLEQRRAATKPWAQVREVRVLVADTWLAATSLPWSHTLRVPATAAVYARGGLLAAGHELDARDVIRFDDAAYGELRLVVAYPAAMLEALQALAAAQGAVLRSTLALSAAVWRLPQRRGMHAMGLADDGLALVVQGERRIGEVHLRRQAATEASPFETLSLLWQRLRLRDTALEATRGLSVLDLSASASPAPQDWALLAMPREAGVTAVNVGLQLALRGAGAVLALDAALGKPAVRARQRWALALAAGFAAWMLAQAWQGAGLLQETRTELAAAQAPEPAPPSAVWTREDLARAQAVNAAVRELNMPIAALLAALQPPRDQRTAILSVEVGAARTEGTGGSLVRVMAEARSTADMTRYVAYLADRKPLEGAYLMRHEIAKEVPGQPYRFTVEAAWKD